MRWLEARTVKGKPLAPMTKRGYRGLLRRNIAPTLGQYALADITPSAVRDWYSKMSVTVACTFIGGGERNRTAVRGFAGPCLNHSATPPERRAS